MSKKTFRRFFIEILFNTLEQTYFVGSRPNYGPNFGVIKILISRLMNIIMIDYEQKTFKVFILSKYILQ